MYSQKAKVEFPEFTGAKVNMMPIVFGDKSSVPDELLGYWDMISACDFEEGTIVYLTVHESVVPKGQSQRRGGIHVEAPNFKNWGGGAWGGMGSKKGIYMASTDGACKVWNEIVEDRDEHGACFARTKGVKMEPSTLYWITDKTPHQALPVEEDTERQFFRLVSEDISLWFDKHNTPNPKGVKPSCEIVDWDKFKAA